MAHGGSQMTCISSSVTRRTITIVDGSVAVTGAFVSAREMARVLHNDVDVEIALPSDAVVDSDSLRDFARVHRLPIRPLRRSALAVLLYLPYLLLAAIRLRILLWRNGSDALLLNDFYLMHGALARLLGYRGKIITWVRIDPAAFGRVASLWLMVAQHTSDHVIAVSRFIQRLLPHKMASIVVYDPISSEFIPEPKKTANKAHVFVYLGNYIPGKGQDVAIEALAEVVRVCPDATIEFYGGDMGLEKNRAYRRELEQRVIELGLHNSVVFGDFATAPRSVLIGKFCALNLSRSESFSRTVLEASACGLPVIATRCGGPEEIIADGETGFLVPVGDSVGCAAAMITLCTTPGLANGLGATGRELVMKRFSHKEFRSRLRPFLKRPC
jgi:L-malate glycosyltransferase